MTVSNALRRACEAVVVVTLLLQLAIVVLNVVLRSFFHAGFIWANETATVALTIIGFIGGALAFERGGHLSVKVVLDRLSPQAREALQASLDWIALAVVLVVGFMSVPLAEARIYQTTPILGISTFWFVLPLPLGMCALAIFIALRLFTYSRRPLLATGAAVALVALLAWTLHPAWAAHHPANAPLIVALVVFFALTVAGLAVGFSLISATVAYLLVSGAPFASLPAMMLSGVDLYVLLALPFFVLAGFIMEKGGISERLVGFIDALVGHLRGGLLYVTIISMYIVSGMSGAKTADIAAVGGVMCDMLRREGYDEGETVAVLATSAVMGETVPPSIAMLVLGSISSLSIAALFVAGLIPAAVVGLCIMALVYVNARRRGLVPKRRAPWSKIWRAGVRALLPLLMPLLLFGGIILGIATPTEVSSFAVVYGLALALYVYRALRWRDAIKLIVDAAATTGMLLFVIGAASAFAYVLTISNLPARILDILGALHAGPGLFLALSLIVVVILGMLLEGLPALLIFGPLLLPIGERLGIDPLHFAIMLIIAMGIGLFSPPFGIGLYVACAVGGVSLERAMRPILPYLGVVCAGVVIIAVFPWLTLALPHALHLVGAH